MASLHNQLETSTIHLMRQKQPPITSLPLVDFLTNKNVNKPLNNTDICCQYSGKGFLHSSHRHHKQPFNEKYQIFKIFYVI